MHLGRSIMIRFFTILALFCQSILFCNPAVTEELPSKMEEVSAEETPSRLITHVAVVLDATASMGARDKGVPSIQLGQWVVSDLLDLVPAEIPFDFFVIKDNSVSVLHGKNADGQDIGPVELQPADKSEVRGRLMQLQPSGKGELKDAFTTLLRRLETGDAPLVVVITDGYDCNPKAGAVAAASELLKKCPRTEFSMVAIRPDQLIAPDLESVAAAAGGNFTAIRSRASIQAELSQVTQACDRVRTVRANKAEQTKEELARVRMQVIGLNASLKSSGQDIAKLQESLSSRERELKDESEKHQATAMRLQQSQRDFNDLDEKHTQLTKDFQRESAANKKLNEEVQNLRLRETELTGELNDAHETETRLNDQIRKFQRSENESGEKLQVIINERDKYLSEMWQAKVQLEATQAKLQVSEEKWAFFDLPSGATGFGTGLLTLIAWWLTGWTGTKGSLSEILGLVKENANEKSILSRLQSMQEETSKSLDDLSVAVSTKHDELANETASHRKQIDNVIKLVEDSTRVQEKTATQSLTTMSGILSDLEKAVARDTAAAQQKLTELLTQRSDVLQTKSEGIKNQVAELRLENSKGLSDLRHDLQEDAHGLSDAIRSLQENVKCFEDKSLLALSDLSGQLSNSERQLLEQLRSATEECEKTTREQLEKLLQALARQAEQLDAKQTQRCQTEAEAIRTLIAAISPEIQELHCKLKEHFSELSDSINSVQIAISNDSKTLSETERQHLREQLGELASKLSGTESNLLDKIRTTSDACRHLTTAQVEKLQQTLSSHADQLDSQQAERSASEAQETRKAVDAIPPEIQELHCKLRDYFNELEKTVNAAQTASVDAARQLSESDRTHLKEQLSVLGEQLARSEFDVLDTISSASEACKDAIDDQIGSLQQTLGHLLEQLDTKQTHRSQTDTQTIRSAIENIAPQLTKLHGKLKDRFSTLEQKVADAKAASEQTFREETRANREDLRIKLKDLSKEVQTCIAAMQCELKKAGESTTAALRSDLDGLKNAGDRIDGILADLQTNLPREVAETQNQVTSLENQFTAASRDLQSLVARLEQVDVRSRKIHQKLSDFRASASRDLSTLRADIQRDAREMERQLLQVKENLHCFDERNTRAVAGLQNDVRVLRDDVLHTIQAACDDALNGIVVHMNAAEESVNAQLNELDMRLELRGNKYAQEVREQLLQLSAQLKDCCAEQRSQLIALKELVGNASQASEDLLVSMSEENRESLAQAVNSLSESLAQNCESLAADLEKIHRSCFDVLSDNLAELDDGQAELKQILEQLLDSLPQDVSSVRQDIGTLIEKLTHCCEDLGDVGPRLSSVEDNVKALEESIAEAVEQASIRDSQLLDSISSGNKQSQRAHAGNLQRLLDAIERQLDGVYDKLSSEAKQQLEQLRELCSKDSKEPDEPGIQPIESLIPPSNRIGKETVKDLKELGFVFVEEVANLVEGTELYASVEEELGRARLEKCIEAAQALLDE